MTEGASISAPRLCVWMETEALPFWATVGHDGAGRGFVEHLDRDARPVDPGWKRVRVQARQIYVFSHAATLGWTDGLDAARDAFDFLRTHAWHPGGGWVRRLGRHGGVVDPVVDLYDNAFVLLALAWLARATADDAPLILAHRTLDTIHARMRHASGGYANDLPGQGGWRQQNPHMHLLEAMLALVETTGDARFAEEAGHLIDLALARFIDPATGTLGEFYTEDWTRAPSPDGARLEPGHHFEWVWLLHRAGALLDRDLRDPAARLFAFATAHGIDPATWRAFDAVASDGTTIEAGARLWPQTAAIKAMLAIRGDHAPDRIAAITRLLFDRYLADTPPGTWIDRFDRNGHPDAAAIPASSLYHLFTAHAELLHTSS